MSDIDFETGAIANELLALHRPLGRGSAAKVRAILGGRWRYSAGHANLLPFRHYDRYFDLSSLLLLDLPNQPPRSTFAAQYSPGNISPDFRACFESDTNMLTSFGVHGGPEVRLSVEQTPKPNLPNYPDILLLSSADVGRMMLADLVLGGQGFPGGLPESAAAQDFLDTLPRQS